MKKTIFKITPFTTLDYKDHLSCIVWFVSCNMRCQYCYNKELVDAKSGKYDIDDFISFLKTRMGLLDGVVLSGGEATCHNLFNICKEIKKLNFDIKLDTNGSNPKQLKNLINNDFLDYVAIDFKANEEKFKEITKSNHYNNFLESLKILNESNIPYEVRTTIHKDLLNETDINKMIIKLKEEKYEGTYFLQNYLNVEDTIGNLQEPTKKFNRHLLENNFLNIEFRNY